MTKAISVTVSADSKEELDSLLSKIIGGSVDAPAAPTSIKDKVAAASKPKKKSNPFANKPVESDDDEDEENEDETPVKKPAKRAAKAAPVETDDDDDDEDEEEEDEDTDDEEADVAALRKELLAIMNKYHGKHGDSALPKLGKVFKKFGASKLTEVKDEDVQDVFDAMKKFIKTNP